MKAELSIIIVNWNGEDLLRRAVESVVEAPPGVSFEIIVIDNASSDDSLARMRASDAVKRLGAEQLRVVVNSENLGFSKANNQGFALTDAPLLLLLNSDAEVRAGAIDKLIETLRAGQRNGACGPRLVNPDGTLQPSVYRNPPTAWETLLSGFRLYRLLPARLRGELLLGGHWDHARRRRVPRLSGAALLVKREVIDDIGGLDERFHMYGEDVEWCLRMSRAGWWLVHEPEAVVMHHGSGSSKQRWGNLETMRRIVDGQLRFQEYCLSRPQRIANITASALVAALSSAWQAMRGGSRQEQRVALSLYAAYFKRALRRE
ncbi:MAG: glycosyltransferase [Acidobacteria bacterium]|nr:glycosyltransferase [Acidobacteriota bacterium]